MNSQRLFTPRRAATIVVAVLVLLTGISVSYDYLAKLWRPANQPGEQIDMFAALRRPPLEQQVAQDFRLRSEAGVEIGALSDFRGKRPVALIFGSYTCDIFRDELGKLEEVYSAYKNEVQFYIVYIREAHADDEFPSDVNEELGIVYQQPTTCDERCGIAATMHDTLNVSIPIVVDDVDNLVEQSYRAWPHRLCLVDVDGRISYSSRDLDDFLAADLKSAIDSTLVRTADDDSGHMSQFVSLAAIVRVAVRQATAAILPR